MRNYRIHFSAWLIAVIAATAALAQSSAPYKVIKAGGHVFTVVSHQQIKAGDLIRNSDKLSFETAGAYLHVATPAGRKTIRNIPDSSPREMQILLQNFLSPDKRQRGSRGAVPSGLEKLIHEMSYDTLLILGNGRIPMDSAGKSLLKPSGVKAIYTTSTGKVEKRISDNTGFNLGREYLFVETSPPYPMVTIMYMEDMDEPVFAPMQVLATFVPLFTNEAVLRTELQTVVNTYKALGWNRSQIMQEVNSYLGAEYAPAVPGNVREWLVGQSLLK